MQTISFAGKGTADDFYYFQRADKILLALYLLRAYLGMARLVSNFVWGGFCEENC